MKTSIFWDVALCKAVKDNRSFGGINRFKFQGLGLNQARNQDEARKHAGILLAYSSILKMEVVSYPKRWLIFSGLHGVICQKTELFTNLHIPCCEYLEIRKLLSTQFTTFQNWAAPTSIRANPLVLMHFVSAAGSEKF
jgi:hypothetical protein